MGHYISFLSELLYHDNSKCCNSNPFQYEVLKIIEIEKEQCLTLDSQKRTRTTANTMHKQWRALV